MYEMKCVLILLNRLILSNLDICNFEFVSQYGGCSQASLFIFEALESAADIWKMETSAAEEETERLQCRFKVPFPKDSLPSFANNHSVEEVEYVGKREKSKERRNSGENEIGATSGTASKLS